VLRHVLKFRWATLSKSKVIGVHLLNFKPIFDPPSFEKNCREPDGWSAIKTWSFSRGCKNFEGAALCLRAEIWFSEKVDLGGHDFTTNLRNY